MKLRNIIKQQKKKNKKGSIVDLLVWLILSFIIVIFFALWIYGFHEVTNQLKAIDTGNPSVNISDAATQTFGQIDPLQTRGLHVLAFVMIFMMGVSILITNFLVKAHPAFFLVYLLIVVVAIIASAYLSNQYEELMTDDIIGQTLKDFKGASWIMLYLPVWTTMIGIFGAILLFAGIIRDSGAGGSLV